MAHGVEYAKYDHGARAGANAFSAQMAGLAQLWFYDPDGNGVELAQAPGAGDEAVLADAVEAPAPAGARTCATLAVAGGNSSYCTGTQGPAARPVALAWAASLPELARSFTDVYESSFALRLDDAAFDPAPARAAAEAAGVRLSAVLVPDPGLADDALPVPAAAVARYRCIIERAAALGARWLVDFGADRPEQADAYVELMRRVAPHAEARGVGIAMKPHGGLCTTLAEMVAIHERVGHPAFGLCLDPGNILYYSRGRSSPTAGLAAEAWRVSVLIAKDFVFADSRESGEWSWQKNVLLVPGQGLVDFEAIARCLGAAGFDGPVLLEKAPGNTTGEITTNFARGRAFVDTLAELMAGSVERSRL